MILEEKDFIYIIEEGNEHVLFPKELWTHIILPFLEFDDLEILYEYNSFFYNECIKIQNNLSKKFFNTNFANKNMFIEYNNHIDEYGEKINLTKVKSYLPLSIIKNLNSESVKNPYYKNAACMKLYDMKDVLKHCAIYHNGYDNYSSKITESMEKSKIRKEKLKKCKENKIQQRRNLLESELNKFKLSIRNDSELCKLYIEGKKTYPLEEIVQIMCKMKFWFEYVDKNIHNKLKNDRNRDINILNDNWDNEYEHDDYHEKWKRPFHEIIDNYIIWQKNWPWM